MLDSGEDIDNFRTRACEVSQWTAALTVPHTPDLSQRVETDSQPRADYAVVTRECEILYQCVLAQASKPRPLVVTVAVAGRRLVEEFSSSSMRASKVLAFDDFVRKVLGTCDWNSAAYISGPRADVHRRYAPP